MKILISFSQFKEFFNTNSFEEFLDILTKLNIDYELDEELENFISSLMEEEP
jgi:ABC-type uncharacterized transport system auxiliary subunit